MPSAAEVQTAVAKTLTYLDQKIDDGSTVIEYFSATVSGNLSFTIPEFKYVKVFADGILLQEDAHYTVDGNTVTLTAAWPDGTEVLMELVKHGNMVVHNVSPTVSTTSVTLPATPACLEVYFDGLLCQFGSVYTFNGNVVSFANAVPAGTELSFVINV